MYSVEGKLIVRENPETFLGRHGIFYETTDSYLGADFRQHTDTDVVWVTGSQRIVNFAANRLRKKGRIPADSDVEKITSLEQAVKYARPTSMSVKLSRFKSPDMPELLNEQVSEGAELLEGEARLWKELRLPTPYIYFLGKGALLSEMEYTPETDWHDRYDFITGSRLTVGVITPILYASYHRTNTSSSKTRYRTYHS